MKLETYIKRVENNINPQNSTQRIFIDKNSLDSSILHNRINGNNATISTGTFNVVDDGLDCSLGAASFSPAFNFGTQHTIMVWFNETSDETRNIIGRNSTTQYTLRVNTPYSVVYKAYQTAPILYFANSAPFEELILVRNNTSASLYLDGKFSETIIDASMIDDTTISTIGSTTCNDSFKQIIIEKSLWNETTIKNIYEQTVLNGEKNKLNILNLFGNTIQSSAKIVNDPSTLYAHESQVLIYRSSNYIRFYKIICFLENILDQNENNVNQSARLKIYDNTSGDLLFDDIYLKANTDYGDGIITGNAGILAPRMWINGNTLYLVGTCDKVVYRRTMDLTTFSLSSCNYFYVNIYGGTSYVLDSSSMQYHLESITGTTSSMFVDATVMLRGNDNIMIDNSIWYLGCESMHYPGGDFAAVPMLMKSIDDGSTWELLHPIYKPAYPIGFCETSFTYLNNRWHVLTRRADIDGRAYWYMYSDDASLWTDPVKSSLKGIGTRHSVTIIKDDKSEDIAIIAYNKHFRGYSTYRNLLGIAKTYDYETFEDIAIINNPLSCHYPCISEKYNKLYITFTTGDKNIAYYDRDSIYSSSFIIPNY